MKPLYRFGRALLYPIFHAVLPAKFVGFENAVTDSGCILCANHTSMSDPIFLGVALKRQINFMAKAELFKNRIFSILFKSLGAFAVERGTGDMAAINQAAELVKKGNVLGIFPEGTRNKVGPPKKMKSGVAYIALATKSDILPCAIYREGKYMLFRKTTVRCGEIIPFSELYDETLSERQNLKNITARVDGEITRLWEMGHA